MSLQKCHRVFWSKEPTLGSPGNDWNECLTHWGDFHSVKRKQWSKFWKETKRYFQINSGKSLCSWRLKISILKLLNKMLFLFEIRERKKMLILLALEELWSLDIFNRKTWSLTQQLHCWKIRNRRISGIRWGEHSAFSQWTDRKGFQGMSVNQPCTCLTGASPLLAIPSFVSVSQLLENCNAVGEKWIIELKFKVAMLTVYIL